MPGCQKLQMTVNPVWHRLLYSCTDVATVGVKGLNSMLLHALAADPPLNSAADPNRDPHQRDRQAV